MSDIALLWSNTKGSADISVLGNDLLTDDGLETAILISLFTDRRVSTDEELPIGEIHRRGWWGDLGGLPSDRIGSRLWLLNREKVLPVVLTRAHEYAKEAVQWLIQDKVANRVEVVVESTRFEELDIQVSVFRPAGTIVKSRYSYNWQAQAAKIIG